MIDEEGKKVGRKRTNIVLLVVDIVLLAYLAIVAIRALAG